MLKFRHRITTRIIGLFMLAVVLSGCDGNAVRLARPTATPGGLDLANEADGTNWPAYGRTYQETHESPLRSINADNVGGLGLAWSMELSDVHNGATVPLAVDGIIYFTVDQSIVRAVDAVTGRLLWLYDPEVGKHDSDKMRYAWGPRGIAYANGKIFVGTLDGYLIALDAKTGRPVWTQLTVGKDDVRYITGAPRVFRDMVIIGHGGADYGAARGYVTAYDIATGRQRWRFYTVPGNPKDGFEDDAMAMAAKTWTGEWWKFGGGGTVWNAMTYDPDFDVIYLGTGNGAPWNQKIRSPGGGDNLFLGSIVALDAATGRYKWHYQENPANTWDFNSVMDMTLATLRIDGRPRKVILHAPKNGFFYVIDRETGKPISAEKYAKVDWATRVDLTTGRPIEVPGARYPDGEAFVAPPVSGAHSWQPQSFNRDTGLIYIPVIDMPGYYNDKGIDPKTWMPEPGKTNLGVNSAPDDIPTTMGSSQLLAWDPVAGKRVWSVKTPGFWNGGTMTTLGNLVFQGQADGYLIAYDARTGRKLWSFYCGMGISGAPITFDVGGRQYVSVVAGWGASAAYLGSLGAQFGWVSRVHQHRLLTFALDGKAALPANLPLPQMVTPIIEPGERIDPVRASRGGALFVRTCMLCHGAGAVATGFAPDLRASGIPLSKEAFAEVVRGGALKERGMPRYHEFSDDNLEDLRAFIRTRARVPPAAGNGRAP